MPCLYFLTVEILKWHTTTTSFILSRESYLTAYAFIQVLAYLEFWLYVTSTTLCFLWSDHWCRSMCLAIAGVAYQSETKSHISYCVTAKSHIIHMGAHEEQPHLFLTHTHLCLARFIANLTHRQQDNYRTLQGIYCYVRYLVVLLVYLCKRCICMKLGQVKSRMWLTSHRLATLVLLYSVSAQNENELVFKCILICYNKLQALLLKCSKFE